jgi:hypothetical protein
MKPVPIFSADGLFNTKHKRVQDYRKQLQKHIIPESYLENTTKEELSMEYVRTFTQQFAAFYPYRKTPYMIAENECGIPKFVCSTIRPSQLNYSELYDMHECAIFLAGYMQYEPLDPPNEPPSVLPSPGQSFDWHTGDSFDMAMILCSLLLGNGYDAYVVNGYAPKYITLRDQSKTPCPLVSKLSEPSSLKSSGESIDERKHDDKGEEERYVIPPNYIQESRFIESQKEKKRLEGLDMFVLWNAEELARGSGNSISGSQPQKVSPPAPPPPAPMGKGSQAQALAQAAQTYSGSGGAHAWVLVKAGRRDVQENTFLEPSTGRAYSTQNSPYEAIESIWTKSNYWVNTALNLKPSEVCSYDYDYFILSYVFVCANMFCIVLYCYVI